MNYYAVAIGKEPGIYFTWKDCEQQVKGVKNAKFKKFNNEEEANQFLASNNEINKENIVPDYYVYTDGACSGNPGPGGWGAVIFDKENNQKNISGNEKNTTNNRMELLAAIMALKKIKSNSQITIYTDSTYVKNGITEWMFNWKKNDWKTASKKPVKNKDLWIKLDKLCEKNKVSWKWVKGHGTNKYNNLADQLATSAIKN